MSRIAQTPNPVRNETEATRLLSEAAAELERIPFTKDGRKKNGNKVHGWAIYYRNRLTLNAGYDYSEALTAVRKVAGGHY